LVPHSVILSFYSAVDGGPQEVLELMVWECLPSMLRNIDGGPPGGVGAGGLNVREIDGGPLGVLAAGLATATTEVEDIDGGPTGGCW
jgi:hypothetical protein